jgi:uncharacterized paraquat-inducible protein A
MSEEPGALFISMAKILTFKSRSKNTQQAAPKGQHPASRDGAIEQGDLRQSTKALCHDCHNVWWAPKIGVCPRCKSEHVQAVASQPLDYKRV